jgi:hypothetical protein
VARRRDASEAGRRDAGRREEGGPVTGSKYPSGMSASRTDHSHRPVSRFRRMLDRLSSSQEELHSEELREDARATGCTRICDCHDRQIVSVTGTLRAVTLRPRAGVPALEAELFDGTAALNVVWLGRRSILGIEPGRKIIASGRISMNRGRPVLFNPKYELRPLEQE